MRCTRKGRCRRIEKVVDRLFEGEEAVNHLMGDQIASENAARGRQPDTSHRLKMFGLTVGERERRNPWGIRGLTSYPGTTLLMCRPELELERYPRSGCSRTLAVRSRCPIAPTTATLTNESVPPRMIVGPTPNHDATTPDSTSPSAGPAEDTT